MKTAATIGSRRVILALAASFVLASPVRISAAQEVGVQEAPTDTSDVSQRVARDEPTTDTTPDVVAGSSTRSTSVRTAAWPLAQSLSDSIPSRVYAFELTELLKDEPASFLYDFSNYGWPHLWSPFGLAQQNVGLVWNDLETNDLFTGRARYEAVPLGAADVPMLVVGGLGRLADVVVTDRAFETAPEPVTEFRYQSGGGLQKVSALHTQTRKVGAGSAGLLNVLFWYRGEGSSGEYPGSRLRRGRQVYGRLRYDRPGWSLEVSDISTRHPLQAHDGVIPPVPGVFDSIYQRLGAQVENEDARRTTLRNDLFARWTRGATSGGGTSLLIGRTTESLLFRQQSDTLKVASAKSFASLRQHFTFGGNTVSVEASGRITRSESRTDNLGFSSIVDRRLNSTVEHSFVSTSLQSRVTLGFEVHPEGTGLTSAASMNVPLGALALRVDAATRPETATVMEATGFGRFVTTSAERPLGRTNLLSGKLTVSAGILDVSLIGALSSSSSWRDFFDTATEDSVRSRPGEGTLNLVTAAADIGLRRHQARGLYLTVKPSLFAVSNVSTSDLDRFDESLPDFFASGRLGARYLIFGGDLNLNVYARGRFWSSFRSRTLHTPTGVLTLPTSDGRPVESSAAIDIIIEGGVRTATLFLAYENLLSGTKVVVGNLLVPVYPLAERRLRFGVFWPITN